MEVEDLAGITMTVHSIIAISIIIINVLCVAN